jgi:Ca2+-binding RTX toxin-like protein
VLLGPGIDPTKVTVTRHGPALTLAFDGTADSLTLRQEGAYLIEQVKFFDGTVWNAAMLESKVAAGNTAPVVSLPIPDVTISEDAALDFRIPDATFADPNDTLTFAAALSDGTALPGWLAFNPDARAFTGTPLNGDVGAFDVRVTATDTGGLAVSDSFRIIVANTNDAPTLVKPVADQSTLEDVPFSLALPVGMFSDVDVGDQLTLRATLANGSALPAWITFDALTQTFHGTPDNQQVGTSVIRVSATDLSGATAFHDFALQVVNVNDAPVLARTLADVAATERQAFALTLPSNSFIDDDVGDVLSYQASLTNGQPMPAWIAFNASTRTFFGTPGEDDVRTLGIRVIATDLAGKSISDDFDLKVVPLPGITLTGTNGTDTLVGTPGADAIYGLAGADKLYGNAGQDAIFGGEGNDYMAGGTGNDSMFGGAGNDALLGDQGDDGLFGEAGVDTLSGGDGNDVLYGGDDTDILIGDDGADVLYGESGSDVLWGGKAADILYGGTGKDALGGDDGNDLLFGQADEDTLLGCTGNDLLDGGAGSDTLDGGDGNDFIAGGAGSDTLNPGAGRDVIVFNRGDGADTIQATGTPQDTLSIGGGIRYADLKLAKNANDLVLDAGAGDKVTFKDWYASTPQRSVAQLQFVAEAMSIFNAASPDPLVNKKIQTFDFQRIVAAFDTARAGNSKLGSWSIAPALMSSRLSSSDTDAFGGILAHEFGMLRSLEQVPAAIAQETLSDARFGVQPQPFASSAPAAKLQLANADPGTRVLSQSDPVVGVQPQAPAAQKEDSGNAQAGTPWEHALQRWLDGENGTTSTAMQVGAGKGGVQSPTELEISAAWRRTQQLLDVHLRSSAGASADAEGSFVRSGIVLPGMTQVTYGALGRVSDQQLTQFSGLEEGLKVLSA